MKTRRRETPFKFTMYAEEKITETDFQKVESQEHLDYLLDELMRNEGTARKLKQGRLLVFEVDGKTYRGHLDIKE